MVPYHDYGALGALLVPGLVDEHDVVPQLHGVGQHLAARLANVLLAGELVLGDVVAEAGVVLR